MPFQTVTRQRAKENIGNDLKPRELKQFGIKKSLVIELHRDERIARMKPQPNRHGF